MTLQEIKNAVIAGRTVYWKTSINKVVQGKFGQWLLVCTINNDAIGLTWTDGQTMNGKPEDFYIGE
jgi:hypothetical protein